MAKYWYYLDHQTHMCYYTESYSMSVTNFAYEVSKITGTSITASDTSYADRDSDLKYFNLVHI